MTSRSAILKLVFPIGLIIFGIIFIIMGVAGLGHASNWPETSGEIQSIELIYEATDSEDSDVYEVMVEYKVDGKTYVSDLGVYYDDFEVGKEIAILYDPESPENIILPGKTGPIVAIIGGVAAIIIAVVSFLLTLARGR